MAWQCPGVPCCTTPVNQIRLGEARRGCIDGVPTSMTSSLGKAQRGLVAQSSLLLLPLGRPRCGWDKAALWGIAEQNAGVVLSEWYKTKTEAVFYLPEFKELTDDPETQRD